MAHRLVGMQPVNMQQLNRLILKLTHSLIKGHSIKRREISVLAFVMPSHYVIHFFSIESSLMVSFPRIHSVATAR